MRDMTDFGMRHYSFFFYVTWLVPLLHQLETESEENEALKRAQLHEREKEHEKEKELEKEKEKQQAHEQETQDIQRDLLQQKDAGVLQCDAVCCSVLQCVAVCCSVLQCAWR